MMDSGLRLMTAAWLIWASVCSAAPQSKRQPDGNGQVEISGELKQWHNVILTLDGPFAHELDNKPNPFIDRQMNVAFTHESGSPSYVVPAYFAADGRAAETSADSGTKWRAHLSPDKTGAWTYTIAFEGTKYDGKTGSFDIAATDKTGIDLRGRGRLHYVGKRYLQFAGDGGWFLKAGADAPETFLAYTDFDNTETRNEKKGPLKTWASHSMDWNPGDPTWKDGKGKGMIGAINYLADMGCNAFSFLPYNAGGDGDNVWPHVSHDDKLHFDCSKLDQWGMIFNHSTAKGMYLHFKLQETENDDHYGPGATQALDSGECGIERKIYLRELIARFGHNLALNWNLGEENTQSMEQIKAMARYIRQTDPYGHNVVLHTYPSQHDKVYAPLLGKKDILTGVSIQNSNVADSHRDALEWVTRSEQADHPWVVAVDEAGTAGTGSPADPDWPGMQEAAEKIERDNQKKAKNKKEKLPALEDIRGQVLWGTLMAGGTGVEYYFGYKLPENDLVAENWRSRGQTWKYSGIALGFFREFQIPVDQMHNTNALIGNPENTNEGGYCFSKAGELYLLYLPAAGNPTLDLSNASGSFSVRWFNPRTGGALQAGSMAQVDGGSTVSLGTPPTEPAKDWVVMVRRSQGNGK